jgi:hypothetical protein
MVKQKRSFKRLTRTITIDLGQERALSGVSVDRTGRIVAFGLYGERVPIAGVKIETGFDTENPKKPRKVVSRANARGDAAYHHIDLYLLRFRRILFLDTNTRQIGDELVSVCSVVMCQQPTILSANGKPTITPRLGCAFEFRGARVPAEQLGWLYAMERIDLWNLKGTQSTVAVVTDHDLGGHEAYNARQRDIAGLRKMPPEFELIYGCADRGETQFANRLMSLADWHSGRMLDLIAADPLNTDGMVDAPADEPYDRLRFWTPQGSATSVDIADVKQRIEFYRIPGVAS